MGLISWIIFGAIVGWIGSKLAGTDAQQGWILNIVLGIIGAILGGIVYGWIDRSKFYIEWSIGSLIVGIIGAFVVSWGYAYLMGRKRV